MYEKLFSEYDPRSISSHPIILLYLERQNEENILVMIDELFALQIWNLPSEIYKRKNNPSIYERVKFHFHQQFSNWIQERTDYAQRINQRIKYPNVPFNLQLEFRNGLITLKNLKFYENGLDCLLQFISSPNASYIESFLKTNLSYLIDKFEDDEVEYILKNIFYSYSLRFSYSIELFIYYISINLCNSSKIHNLSLNFKQLLSEIQHCFVNNNNFKDRKKYLSILSLEIIINKKIDFESEFIKEITNKTLCNLPKGTIYNYDVFTFLNTHNCNFANIDLNDELSYFIRRLNATLIKVEESNLNEKLTLLNHLIHNSHTYIYYFFLLLKYSVKPLPLIEEFIRIIDNLRSSFNEVIWYHEYLNFTPIQGYIDSCSKDGFNVMIDEKSKNAAISRNKNYLDSHSEYINRLYNGFLPYNLVKEFIFFLPKTFSTNHTSKQSFRPLSEDELTYTFTLKNFHLNTIDYRNRKSILKFQSFNSDNFEIIREYSIKKLFTSLETTLIDFSYNLLNFPSPITSLEYEFKNSSTIDSLTWFKNNENEFWGLLKEKRPDLYLKIYIKENHLKESFDRIINYHNSKSVVEGHVLRRCKGGLIVEIEEIEAFLPGSQIDVKPVRDYDQYVGKTMEFKVVKINPVLRNAVVSHKILIESDIEAQKVEIMSRMEKGQVLEGTIKNLTDFGVFVDLGGVDGLLHITDMSWGRISHPSEMVKLNDKVQVVVIDFDDERKRISLGMKQLTAHPWEASTAGLEAGSIVEGKVVTLVDYGAFLEIAPGVEGLVHVSEMSWSQHLRNPQDFIKQGDVVKAVILSIDKEERKMSLGLKQLSPDPWLTIREKFPAGTRLSGRVYNLTNFGLFVELGEGVDGLVHVSDLSWTKKINHPSEFVKKDQMLDVIVLEIDTEARRLSLGHKQLEENPWDTFATIFFENSVHQGTIVSVDNKGGMVQFSYGVEAFVPKKQMLQADNKSLKVEDKADFKIIEFNKENRRIVASHARTWNIFAKNTIHVGTVVEASFLGCTVKFESHNVRGEVNYANMKKPNNEILKKGEKAQFQVIGVAKEGQYISVKYYLEIN